MNCSVTVEDGFTQLAAFDTDLNGVINSSDVEFSNLLVWQDINTDGVSQANELQYVSDWGITEISLTSTNTNYLLQGHVISHEGTFTINGQSHDVVEAWFALDNTNSRYVGEYTLDIRTAFLPTMRGYGQIADLHITMSQKESLLLAVQDVATKTLVQLLDPAYDLQGKITNIMYQWAGVENVNPTSRGTINAQELGFVEAMTGTPYVQEGSPNPFGNSIARIEQAYDSFYDAFLSRILIQSAGQSIFTTTGQYNPVTDDFTGVYAFDLNAVETLFNSLNLSGADLSSSWNTILRLIDTTVGLATLSPSETATLNAIIQGSDPAGVLTLDNLVLNITVSFWGSNSVDTFFGTAGNDRIWGQAGDDILQGNAGNDNLNGGAGNDSLDGGVGNDSVTGDVGNDSLTGGTGNDLIYGGSGNDTLIGGVGNDTLDGNTGVDTYHWSIGDGNDVISDSDLNSNIDTLSMGGTLTASDLRFEKSGNDLRVYVGSEFITIQNHFLSSSGVYYNQVERILFSDSSSLSLTGGLSFAGTSGDDTIVGGVGNDTLYGNGGNDTLIGSSGDDILYGGAGDDYLSGGSGNNTLYGDDGNDNLDASAGSGTLYGGSGNDTLGGGSGVDYLYGGSGSDTLNGRAGADTYYWSVGDGNDVIIDNDSVFNIDTLSMGGTLTASDLRFERANFNNDLRVYVGSEFITIQNHFLSSSGIYYNQLERIVFSDSSSLNLTGGLTLTGTSANDTIVGTQFSDTIYGLAGNDSLGGGSGVDYLYGGSGSDTLNGRAGSDIFVFNLSSAFFGIDTIADFNISELDKIDLSDLIRFEPLSQNITDFIQITTSGANSILKVDTNGGGDGFVQIAQLSNVTGLTDEQSLFSTGRLMVSKNLAPVAQNDNFVTLNNVVLTGNLLLNNGNGLDTDPENDALVITAGTFVTSNGASVSVSSDGSFTYTSLNSFVGADSFNYTLVDSYGASDVGIAYIQVDQGNRAPIAQEDNFTASYGVHISGNLLANNGNGVDADPDGDTPFVVETSVISAQGRVVTISSNGDFVYTAVPGYVGVDSFTYTLSDGLGGADTAIANITINPPSGAIVGTANSETLTGTSGVNTMFGLDGNDILNGVAANDFLYGNAGNDTLNGGTGADTLAGGTGDDTYIVDNTGDIVTENTGEGTDGVQSSVSHTLSSNVENLTLTGTSSISGTGNDLNNSIIGNTGNNTINGGIGADTLMGGLGNDTYVVDAADDVVVEADTAGTDTIQSSVTYTASANVERLTLTGAASINAIGNILNNTLTGNTGNNILNGLEGADTMVGGAGDDTYIVDNSSDVITESASAGTDSVESSVTYTLSSNVERLTLIGSGLVDYGFTRD